jgi:hypothetical protein
VKVFTLEIDGQPTMVFDADSIEEARGICGLPEFRADLSDLKRHGKPLFGEVAVFAARDATDIEVVAFKHAMTGAGPSEGPTMAFLVPVDGMLVTIVQPE